MPKLPELLCPSCGQALAAIEAPERSDGHSRRATSFERCLRRCVDCGLGYSNALRNPIPIYRDPRDNVPAEVRPTVLNVLGLALNSARRTLKRDRFAYTTSKDAVAWTIMRYLQAHGRIRETMRASTSLALPPSLGEPDVLLWGVPVNDQGEPRYDEEAMALRRRLVSVLHDLGETPSHYTEPDVALFWQDGSLVIVEAVFGAPNARTTSPSGRVALDALAFADPTAVVATGYCRLARLWQIAYQLGAGGSLSLLNVGTRHLEASVPSRRRLAIFRRSLARPTEGGFAVVHWTDLLPDKPEMPRWLVDYCRSRNIWPLRDAQPPLPKR